MTLLLGFLQETWLLIAAMAPFLLLGLVVAGALHVILPIGAVAKHMGQSGALAVLKASILGVPLPLCSCSVVPVAAKLKKSGASTPSVVSFLVTTPTSGVDSILATYSLLGWAFALARTVASFIIGLVAGMLVHLADHGQDNQPPSKPKVLPSLHKDPIKVRLKTAIVYGFGDMMDGMSRSLAAGSLLGGAISYFLPPDLLNQYVGDGIWAYLVMLGVGAPLYVCASGSIPFAAALLAKGVSPGAALVFLIAGPATNAATIGVISTLLGRKVLAIYLSVLAIGAVGSGAALDFFFRGFPVWMPSAHHLDHIHSGAQLGWLNIASGLALVGLIAFHEVRKGWSQLRATTRRKGMALVKVGDMTCMHCSGSVEKAVRGVAGVRSVHADPGSKIVAIEADGELNMDEILRAIKAAGFHPEVASV